MDGHEYMTMMHQTTNPEFPPFLQSAHYTTRQARERDIRYIHHQHKQSEAT
jgi:hypothetical protein